MPLPPNRGNARGHWRVQWKRKQDFYDACDERQAVGLIPAPPTTPITKAELHAWFYVHNLMDYDNLAARLKHALDWLVTRGYLEDDRPANLRITGIEQEIDRQDKRVELGLTDVG